MCSKQGIPFNCPVPFAVHDRQDFACRGAPTRWELRYSVQELPFRMLSDSARPFLLK
jgi:hypothetical protein